MPGAVESRLDRLASLVDGMAEEEVEAAREVVRARLLRFRFWSFACPEPNSGCWLWTGAISKSNGGYGAFRVGARSKKASRLAWEFTYGPIPAGLFVLHRCDVPPCVNPEHLFLGTALENTEDMAAKGRLVPSYGGAVLDEDQVRAIRIRLSSGASCTLLAVEYGVTDVAIRDIKRGRSWNHVS